MLRAQQVNAICRFVSPPSDDRPSRVYALHYRSSSDRNFTTWAFIKQEFVYHSAFPLEFSISVSLITACAEHSRLPVTLVGVWRFNIKFQYSRRVLVRCFSLIRNWISLWQSNATRSVAVCRIICVTTRMPRNIWGYRQPNAYFSYLKICV
jgi:hypothetical protein